MRLEIVYHTASAPFRKVSAQFQFDHGLGEHAEGDEHGGHADGDVEHVENSAGSSERQHLAIADGGDGGEGHVERFEKRVTGEGHVANAADTDNGCDGDHDLKYAPLEVFEIGAVLTVRHQVLRMIIMVMSSAESGANVHWLTASKTSRRISSLDLPATRWTVSMRRSSPNISSYSFSGSVMPSV